MSRLEEIEQRAKNSDRVYGGEHVIGWRLGVCVGDSEDVPYLLNRVRELEAALGLLADDDNWEYGDSGKFWFHRDANGQGTDAQEIARAALAGGES